MTRMTENLPAKALHPHQRLCKSPSKPTMSNLNETHCVESDHNVTSGPQGWRQGGADRLDQDDMLNIHDIAD